MELNVLNFYASISKKKKKNWCIIFLFSYFCSYYQSAVGSQFWFVLISKKKFANSIKVRLVESSVIFSIIVSLWLIIASRLDHLRSKQFSLNQFEGGFEEENN